MLISEFAVNVLGVIYWSMVGAMLLEALIRDIKDKGDNEWILNL